MISLGRQAIADAFWPAKVKAGREKDIIKCIRRQRCIMAPCIDKWSTCSVNPTVGYEDYYPELWKTDGLDKKAKRVLEKLEGLEQI